MKKVFFIVLTYITGFGILKAQDKSSETTVHEFSKSRLLKMKNIFELLKETDRSVNYSKYICRSFDLVVNISGTEYTETSTGGEFSEKQKDLIAKAGTGSKLYIEKTGVLKPGKHELSVLPDMIFKLKE